MKMLFIAIVCLFSSVLLAEQKIETIQLNHRLTIEVLPEVQAFLPKNATARAFNNYIILQASPAVIADIKQLIHQLDTPPQRLKISVIKTDQRLDEQDSLHVEADGTLTNNDLSGHVSVKKWSSNTTTNKDQQYHAQGLAGKSILITMGQAIPQHQQDIIILANGAIAVQSSTQYINLQNGFQAIARILPNHQVTIDIHPRFSQYSKRSGTIESTDLISSLAGPVGSWIELGHIDNENNIDKQGSTRYRSHQKLQQTIYIKVDPL